MKKRSPGFAWGIAEEQGFKESTKTKTYVQYTNKSKEKAWKGYTLIRGINGQQS
jgi:hypothetical protein